MQLNVDITAEAFLAKLRGTGDRLSQNMQRVVTRLSVEVQAAVKDKLTGDVLHVRTGTLRRSINREVKSEPGGGATASIGTNVKYAGVHEFGFNGSVQVPAHERKIRDVGSLAARIGKNGSTYQPTGNTFVSRSGGTPTQMAPRPGVTNVRAYTMQMNMPERSFLRSTLTDFTPRIREELRKAAMDAVL